MTNGRKREKILKDLINILQEQNYVFDDICRKQKNKIKFLKNRLKQKSKQIVDLKIKNKFGS